MPSFGYICNERRVLPTGTLRIGVKSTTVAGYPALYNSTTGNRISQTLSVNTPANGVGYVEITWGNLCPQLNNGNGFCDFASNTTLNVGIDKANNATKDSDDDVTTVQIIVNNAAGASDFSTTSFIDNAAGAPGADALYGIFMQAGDEKAYLLPPLYGSAFPVGPVANWVRYRLYFSNTPVTLATPIESLGIAEFDVIKNTDNTIDVSPNMVDGLDNGTTFYFIGAHVDQANNIGYFTDLAVPMNQVGVIPDFVYGLLSEDFECFVATATYGTPDAREVLTLRQFRNYLIQYHDRWARPFIRFYYKHSPALASFIRDNETLKSISRYVLWAPIQFAKISLRHGLAHALFVFWSPVLLLLILFFWVQGRRNAKSSARH